MIASSLESIFISYPVDGEDNTIRRSVRVRSPGDGADVFGFRSNFLLVSALLNSGTISALETISRSILINYWGQNQIQGNYSKGLESKYILERVAAIGVHFTVG
jgi:hypothetical protein